VRFEKHVLKKRGKKYKTLVALTFSRLETNLIQVVNMVLSFESVERKIGCEHSNESF